MRGSLPSLSAAVTSFLVLGVFFSTSQAQVGIPSVMVPQISCESVENFAENEKMQLNFFVDLIQNEDSIEKSEAILEVAVGSGRFLIPRASFLQKFDRQGELLNEYKLDAQSVNMGGLFVMKGTVRISDEKTTSVVRLQIGNPQALSTVNFVCRSQESQ